jgi:hypothetical protein
MPNTEKIKAEARLRWWRITSAVVVSVAVSVILSMYFQHDSLVAGCERNSNRASLSANGFEQLAERVRARGNPGDAKSAANYEASSWGFVSVIPGFHGDMTIVEVEKKKIEGKEAFVLTPRAQRLQAAGCEDAFPAPIPFVS